MATGNDMKAHTNTYGSFLGMLKWGSIAVAVITAFVILIIS